MEPLTVDRIRADIAAAIVLIVFCLAALYIAAGFDPPILRGYPGAAFFPRLILSVLLIFTVTLLVRGWRAERRRPPPSGGAEGPSQAPGSAMEERTFPFDLYPLLLAIAAAFAFLAVMVVAGLEVAGTLFLTVALGIRGGRWFLAAAAAVVSVAVIYAVFVLALKVHLPLLFLPRYL